jgi:hypothetical protein
MELNGICPWCGGDRLYYNPKKDVYICFRAKCGRRGKGRPPVETWLSISTSPTPTNESEQSECLLPDGCRLVGSTRSSKSHIALCIKEYLVSHLVSEREARKAGILATYRSLVYPLYDEHGHLTYWQERMLFRKGRRFNNPPRDKGGGMFFTEPNPRSCAFVESVIGAVRVARLIPAGAFLGKPSKAQLDRLKRSKWLEHALILMDADALGAAVEILGELSRHKKTSLVVLPYGDPCNFSDWQLRRFLNEAKVQTEVPSPRKRLPSRRGHRKTGRTHARRGGTGRERRSRG